MLRQFLALILAFTGLVSASAAERSPAAPAEPDMLNLKRELSALAVRVAKEGYGITLDYSPESVRRVEEILGKVHDEYLKSKSEDGLRGLAAEFGAYIIVVIEKNYGAGDWKRDHPTFGEKCFPFYWKGSTIFPVGWCGKRIFDGPGDNVWMKVSGVHR